jgi:hypothetical protein
LTIITTLLRIAEVEYGGRLGGVHNVALADLVREVGDLYQYHSAARLSAHDSNRFRLRGRDSMRISHRLNQVLDLMHAFVWRERAEHSIRMIEREFNRDDE